MNDTTPTAQHVATPEDLAACAAEAIQTPETIQGFGAMAVFDVVTGELVKASANLVQLLNSLGSKPIAAPPQQTPPPAASEELQAQQVLNGCGLAWADLLGCLDPITRSGTVPLGRNDGQHEWIALCHQPVNDEAHSLLIVELAPDRQIGAPPTSFSHGDSFLNNVTSLCLRIQRSKDTALLLGDAASMVQGVLGYHRVMVYEFDHDWNGTVVAEATSPGVKKQFLDHRFPATDIPPQARALYEKNHLRIVGDVDTLPVPLMRLEASAGGGAPPLDQSHALLRAPSNMHIRYLQNMGVRSTLAISLMANGRLWGMLVCHHDEPRIPPYHLRRDLLNAARIISLALESRLAFLMADKQRRHQEQINHNLAELDTLLETATDFNQVAERFLSIVKQGLQCDAVTICLNHQTLGGDVLHAEVILDLLKRHHDAGEHMLSTNSVAKDWHWPLDTWALEDVSGVISAWSGLPLGLQVVARRQSHLTEVKWAGRPELFTRVERPDGSVALGARNSFATWVQRVEGLSAPWTSAEQQHLSDLVLRLSRFFLSRYLMDAKSELDLVGAFVPLIQDFVIVLDHRPTAHPLGAIVYVNPAVLTETGYRNHELSGKGLSVLLDSISCEEAMRSIQTRQQSGSHFELRLRVRRRNGSGLWTSARFTPIRAPDASLQFWVCIQRDISEKIDNELRLQEANLRLEDEVCKRTKRLTLALRDVEKISYSMAHDLRGPLRAINGFSNILKDELDGIDNPAVMESLDRITASTSSMAQMISDLIGLMYVVQGDLKYVEIDINAMVAEVWALLKPGDRQVEFRVSDLPPAKGDPRWLKQLLLNLTENALKYSSKKERPVIQLGYSDKEQAYWISDNGVGMDVSSDSAKSKLFGLFQKMHSGRQFEGAGIGLAIVARIVERHHGRIWVNTSPGEGCTFYWTLGEESSGDEPHKNFSLH